MRSYLTASFAVRFWAKVDKSGDCWIWTVHRRANAIGVKYGNVSIGRRGAGSVGAHRAAYELTFGPIPDGMDVCHTCDNTLCVRPDHLFLGTHADNMRDEAQKGRAGRARLSNAQVVEIRTRYAQGGIRTKDLAREYGIGADSISAIIRRVRRVHI